MTGTTRTRSILMRVTDAELERLQRAADAAGEPLTSWVRQAALRAAKAAERAGSYGPGRE